MISWISQKLKANKGKEKSANGRLKLFEIILALGKVGEQVILLTKVRSIGDQI